MSEHAIDDRLTPGSPEVRISRGKEEKMSDDVMGDRPAPLPPEVTGPAELSFREEDLPLHMRVLRAIVEGQTDKERVDRAFSLANEIYELETANIALENYRST